MTLKDVESIIKHLIEDYAGNETVEDIVQYITEEPTIHFRDIPLEKYTPAAYFNRCNIDFNSQPKEVQTALLPSYATYLYDLNKAGAISEEARKELLTEVYKYL